MFHNWAMFCLLFLAVYVYLVKDTLGYTILKDPVDKSNNEVYGCEGNYAWLECPAGTAIYVTKATYGRTRTDICQHEKGLHSNKNCLQSKDALTNTTIKVMELCDNRRTCSVFAFNSMFGDPCNGTYKYVTVEFNCAAKVCKNIYDTKTCDSYAFGPWAKVNGSECVNNPIWMARNCWKSCTNCNADCPNVARDDAQCDLFALRGECLKNPNWMYAYCQRSCKACSPSKSCKNLLGDDTRCQNLAAQGKCVTTPLWMFRNCRKACGACVKGCYDLYQNVAQCQQYARQGECEKNPNWMLTLCTKSCGMCPKIGEGCMNKNPTADCDARRKAGECSTNPKWMLTNCKQACLCFKGNECLNDYRLDWKCDNWAKTGECQHNPGWMIPNCRRSCDKCTTK